MKIAVAISGGVDSTAAALILLEQGHEVIGLTLKMHDRSLRGSSGGILAEAAEAAERLGVPHHVVDVRERFTREIMAPFCAKYMEGRTPNPCVRCDAAIKFPALASFAGEHGCGAWATGHYTRTGRTPEGRFYISMGADRKKDQSYFLYRLSQESLRGLLFPLGELTKDDARAMVAERGIPCVSRGESQEICFIPDNDYPGFISEFTASESPPGEIVSRDGRVIGSHAGITRYTIGQRRGLGIAAPRPMYVTGIDAGRNRIIAGFREELECRGLVAEDICFMKEKNLDGMTVMLKTRSMQPPFEADLKTDGASMIAVFREPQIQITPGQSAVFYSPEMDILGGGIIVKSF